MKSAARLAVGASMLVTALAAPAQTTVTWLETSKAWGSAVADFNRDGHADLFACGHDGSNDRIWYWSPSGYTPSPQIFPVADRHDCDAADVDQDGLVDLYCAIGAERGTGVKANELWMQGADGVFTLATNTGVEDPYGRSRIPLFLDFNHDGYPDLYLTNDSTVRKDGQPNINHLFINQGGHGFVEAVTVATGNHGFQCVAKGDIDHDGWDDLLVCDSHGPGHLYLNNRAGDFVDLTGPAIGPSWNDAKLADLNGDGLDDLVVLTKHGGNLRIWLNTGAPPYYDQKALDQALPGTPVSVVVGDFNHDGLKDLYVVMDDSQCTTSLVDKAPDIVFWGQPGGGWQSQTLAQDFTGCGHLADVLDGDKVLLENGGVNYKGPIYVLDWTTSAAGRRP